MPNALDFTAHAAAVASRAAPVKCVINSLGGITGIVRTWDGPDRPPHCAACSQREWPVCLVLTEEVVPDREARTYDRCLIGAEVPAKASWRDRPPMI